MDLVLKALGMAGGMTDAQLTDEQKRRLEAIKEEEAKRRRVLVEAPPGLSLQPQCQKAGKGGQPEGSEGNGRDSRSKPRFWAPLESLCGRPSMGLKGSALSLLYHCLFAAYVLLICMTGRTYT